MNPDYSVLDVVEMPRMNSGSQLSTHVSNCTSTPVNPALKYLETLSSENSRISMASKLNVVARMVGAENLLVCDWSTLRAEHVLSVMKRLEVPDYGERKHGPATVNCYLSALKGVAKAAWLSGLIPHEVYLRIQAVRQRRFHRLPTGR